MLCANEVANPGVPRKALNKVIKAERMISLTLRRIGERCSVDRRGVISKEPLFPGNGEDIHQGTKDAGIVGGRLGVRTASVPAVIDPITVIKQVGSPLSHKVNSQ